MSQKIGDSLYIDQRKLWNMRHKIMEKNTTGTTIPIDHSTKLTNKCQNIKVVLFTVNQHF